MPKGNRIGGRRWTRLRDQVVFEEGGICHLCGGAGADTADHLIPVKYAPELEFVRDNLHAAHQSCNLKRGARPIRVRKEMNKSREW